MGDAVAPKLHGRDHCPGGVDPIPCFGFPYVYRRLTTSEDIPAGTNEALEWDVTDNTEGGGFFVIPGAPGGNSVTNIIESGVYHFLAAVKWNTEFNAGAFIVIALDSAGWYPSAYWKAPFNGGTALRSDSTMMIDTTIRMPTGITSFDIQVCHESGSTQTVVDAFLRVARVNTWTGAAEADFAFL